MKRPVFSFRPDLESPEHREAWEILQGIPKGQKNQYLVRAILKAREGEHLEGLIRKAVREAMDGGEAAHPAQEPQGEVPSQMLEFLFNMEEGQ